MALLSLPREIEDRTEFLLGNVPTNPGHAIAEIILRLETAGATVAGIPCHTAHAPPIFNVIVEGLRQAGSKIRLLHMIEETATFIRKKHAQTKTVGVLCTTGTYRASVYPDCLEKEGLNVLPASTAGLIVLLEHHRKEPLPGDRYVVILTGRNL